MEAYVGHIYWVRLLLQRGLAAIYLVAFLSALNQFRPLLGDKGLLPVPRFLERVTFLEAPSVFHFRYSDRVFVVVALAGSALSLALLLGVADTGPIWLSILVWLALWALYLSIVNVGQAFYAFGWESMLVEAGFFAAFLGPARVVPAALPILFFRWMLFRTELGAGLIKLRHDPCWQDLTCLYYHYETQPLPNPLSWYFHRLPKWMHRFSVFFSHFVQVLVPFAFFGPQPIASVAGALAIFHQLWLIVSGNYAWLNWLTVVLAFSTLSIPAPHAALAARPAAFDVAMLLLAGVTIALSIKPALNLFSKNQAMNLSYNPVHLVNAYGAFGTVTRERYEVVLEGTDAAEPTASATWREYPLRAKPGKTRRRPPQIAPYHLRLDWLLWFLPFSTYVTEQGVFPLGYERWFLELVRHLLEGDRATLRLFGRDPFSGARPTFVRARYYRYRFTDAKERKRTGAYWRRTRVGDYLPPVSLKSLDALEHRTVS